jgi:hypothetical protein
MKFFVLRPFLHYQVYVGQNTQRVSKSENQYSKKIVGTGPYLGVPSSPCRCDIQDQSDTQRVSKSALPRSSWDRALELVCTTLANRLTKEQTDLFFVCLSPLKRKSVERFKKSYTSRPNGLFSEFEDLTNVLFELFSLRLNIRMVRCSIIKWSIIEQPFGLFL